MNQTQKRLSLFVGILLVISVVGLIYSLVRTADFNNENLLQIKAHQGELLAITSKSVDQKIGTISQQMNEYAAQISSNEIRAEHLGSIINHDLRVNDGNILSVGVIFFNRDKKIRSQRLYWKLQNYHLMNAHYSKATGDEERWLANR